MIVQKDMPYGSGSAHRLDLYTPHQPSGNLLLYFHGGGLEGGDKSDLNLMPEMLTDQGITLVSANYRMYPEARFPDYVDDCARAAAWAWQYAQSQASPLGLYIGGSSAGAYLAMMLFADNRYLARSGLNPWSASGSPGTGMGSAPGSAGRSGSHFPHHPRFPCRTAAAPAAHSACRP